MNVWTQGATLAPVCGEEIGRAESVLGGERLNDGDLRGWRVVLVGQCSRCDELETFEVNFVKAAFRPILKASNDERVDVGLARFVIVHVWVLDEDELEYACKPVGGHLLGRDELEFGSDVVEQALGGGLVEEVAAVERGLDGRDEFPALAP